MQQAGVNKIGAGQLFLTLFVGRVVFLLSMNTVLVGGESLQELIPSCLASYLLQFLLFLPLWLLHRRRPDQNLLQAAKSLLGRFGFLFLPLYALYFLFFAAYLLSLLQLFMANIMEPHASLPLIAIVTALSASYAAWKGIETIGRTGAIVSVFAACSLAAIFFFLSLKINPLNFVPFFEDGGKQAASGILLLLARSDGLTAIAFLGAQTRGRLGLGFVIWNTVSYAVIAGLLAVMTGAMGAYLGDQLFPFYAAASFAEMGAVQGMDAVLIGIWIFCMLVKLSTDLYLLRLCVESAAPRAGKWSVLVGAVLTAGLSLAICSMRDLQKLFYGSGLFLPFTLVCAAGVPLLLLICDLVRRGKAEKKGGKGKAKKAAALLLSMLLVFSASGCREQIRLNRRLLIEGIGIDLQDETFLLTVQTTKITEGETREVSVYTAEGPSILEALGSLTQQTGQDPLYSHALVVVFGRSCADAGISGMLDFFVRNAETRPNAQIMMAEGDASEVLTAKREEKTVSAKVLGEILETQNMNGNIARITLTDFVNHFGNDGACPYLPVVRPADEGVEAAGTALLDQQGRILAVLDEKATRGALYLLGGFDRGLETVLLPDGSQLTAELHDLKTDITALVRDGTPAFSISIRCAADIGALDGGVGTRYGESAYAVMEQTLAEEIKKETQTALDLCLGEYGADIFLLGRRLHQANPKEWQKYAEQWPQTVSQAVISVQTKVEIARVGQEDTPAIE